MLYGLHWDNVEFKLYAASIDPNTAVFTKLVGLPGINGYTVATNCVTFDDVNNRYIFLGCGFNGYCNLYSIDVVTGNIISNPPFQSNLNQNDYIIELQFDNSSNTLYALHWDNSENMMYLVSINPGTGSFVKIHSLQGVTNIDTVPNYSTFDEINHRFIFRGGDDNGNRYLYSVNVNNGNIISNPVFPVMNNPNDNLIELQFDNSNGNLYGLHWESNTPLATVDNEMINNKFKIYPNPIIDNSKIVLDKQYNEINAFIYNNIGQMVKKIKTNNSSEVYISRENLVSGQYFIAIICDHLFVGSDKIIIK